MVIAATQWITFYLLNNIKGIIGQTEALQFSFSIVTSFMASDTLFLDSMQEWLTLMNYTKRCHSFAAWKIH